MGKQVGPLLGEQVSFFVPGVPAPQGSKVRTTWGLREDNPKTRPWREAVAWEAVAARQHGSLPLMSGPVAASLRFVFPRPKHHYRTGKNQHLLKDSAAIWHSTKPDIDKLQRAVFDSLSGVLIQDDSQIAKVLAEKMYCDPDDVPGVHVCLRPF